MNLLQDILTYIRRIIKSPSNSEITDNLLIDYVNRFWLMDVDARIQLFDLKTKYQFQTQPGVDKYNMPLYDIQVEPGAQQIASFPVYQGFTGPAFIDGIPVSFYTERNLFNNMWPSYLQMPVGFAQGDGSAGPYNLQLPFMANVPNPATFPISSVIMRGHVDIAGIIATGQNIDPPIVSSSSNLISSIPTTSVDSQVFITSTAADGSNIIVQDSGEFLLGNTNLGLLMEPGKAPFGNQALTNGYSNSFAITGITQANPAVLTSATNFVEGQIIQITDVVGMTELNGNFYTVTAVTPTTVTINVDSSGFTAYISGGNATSFSNVINYLTGEAINVFFPQAIPSGTPISIQANFYQLGIPRAVLFYNNTLTLRSPPNTQYLVELDAYLTPAAFLTQSQAVPFGYMSEYIARGAARKILSDTGDFEQFNAYEPLFREQENLVHIRSQRQWTSTRTQTIYSGPSYGSINNYNQNFGGI